MNYNSEVYSPQSQGLFQEVFRFAARLEHGFIGSEHILWGTAHCGGSASVVLKRYGLEAELIEEYLRQHDRDAAAAGGAQAIQFSKDMERVIETAEKEARKQGGSKIGPEHLLAGILLEESCAAAQLMQSLQVSPGEVLENLLAELRSPKRVQAERQQTNAPSAKTLEKYSRDLTAEAQTDGIDPVIGREAEIERIVQILSRRTKNNPVLIGEPGVGKTAVAEGLAQRIAEGRIPRNLSAKRVLCLDLTGMVAGTRFRGDFEERIKTFLDEAVAASNVILFLDELHMLIGAGAGSDGTMDAANILKPLLSRGDLQVVGATTLTEYQRHIEKDAALERRFQPVMVEEPSHEEAVQILMGLRERFEAFHELSITDGAIRAAVNLSARYVGDRFLPDKAVDLMDEAASRIRTRALSVPAHLKALENEILEICAAKKKAAGSQHYEQAAKLRDNETRLRRRLDAGQSKWQEEQGRQVDTQDIAEVVATWTKIPVTMLTQEEGERLKALEATLHKRVIGQNEAVTAVSRAIRRGRTGVAEPDRPIGSFLFLGPTGVGKTELCRALAEVMFQDENAMIRLDMSEYMERHTVSRLVGSPPGYVGYDQGGQLTEKVRRKPYSIILFDEIEKAHPDVWNTLLQVMDDGRLTDAHGRTVSFKNTIIVMTSNIGARDILGKRALGFAHLDEQGETRSVQDIRSRVMEELKKTFQPEFLNRLDETIVFHQLEREHLRRIARGLTDRLSARLEKQGIKLIVDNSALDVLAEKSFDPSYGARPLRRSIQSMLETPISDIVLSGAYSTDQTLIATSTDGEVRLKTRKKRKQKTPATVNEEPAQ